VEKEFFEKKSQKKRREGGKNPVKTDDIYQISENTNFCEREEKHSKTASMELENDKNLKGGGMESALARAMVQNEVDIAGAEKEQKDC